MSGLDSTWVATELGRLVADRTLAVGIQFAASVEDRSMSFAAGIGGTGRPLSEDAVMRVYCAGKPYIAAAFIDALAAVSHDFLAPVHAGALADGLVAVCPPDLTTVDLLAHNTRLVPPVGTDTLGFSTRRRRDLCLERVAQYTGGVGYSEVTTWEILADLTHAATGRDPAEVVREFLRGRLGLESTWFGLSDQEIKDERIPVEANVRLDGLEGVPLLGDTTPIKLRQFDVAYGGYSTAKDLQSFYRWMLAEIRDGPDSSTGGLMALPWRPRILDASIGHACAFGLGVMRDLSDFGFGPDPSKTSVGHSGFMGTAFGLADPEHDLALGVIVVGISDPGSQADFLRPTLVRLAYRWATAGARSDGSLPGLHET